MNPTEKNPLSTLPKGAFFLEKRHQLYLKGEEVEFPNSSVSLTCCYRVNPNRILLEDGMAFESDYLVTPVEIRS